ncbi:type II secretion system F family protein [Palleronia sp. LCG004]|uniref:type II secretion system F family protein n=1 Tax=Palleronia sp. LCG004 TaxID=3079304 RepID=UPI00294264FC|nr:type II secretion system F family protein [Palleronia sp. LCG004]WOI55696.1 type II secretion system F family protein [Palleronia sp. LCG004]
MNALMQFLLGTFGPAGPILAVGALGLVLIVASLPFLVRRRVDPIEKLRQRTRSEHAAEQARGAAQLRLDGNDALAKYSAFLEPQDAEEYSAIRLRLIRAGYRGKNAVRTYHFAQFALGIGFLGAGLLYALAKGGSGATMTTQNMILSVLIPGVVGYMAPKYWVTKRLQQRQEEILNGFPDSLDMMLVCVEAGQSIDQSITRVAREIRPAYPALAEEYAMVGDETRAGKDKATVLRDMAERAGVTDVSNFVTVLIQSAAFGTSVAEALRVYALEMRDKRVMRAEEKANTLPTKMTLATMMMTVPPLLVILLGPSIYSIVVVLGDMAK